MAEDNSNSIENAILDKLGKNDINWEKSNFYSLTKKWLTFEEINDDKLTRPIQTEKVSGVELGAGAS
jgi:DNA-directed RNA polymerase specialized sigma subunit